MSFEKITGVVLNSWDIDFDTKGVNVFSLEYGKIPIYALGVNKMTSKNRYSIQTYSQSDFEIFKARKKQSLSKLKTGYIIETNINIAKNLNSYTLLTIITEVINAYFETNEFNKIENETIYNNFLILLKSFREDKNTFKAYIFFLCFMISFSGYKWTLTKCGRCNKERKGIIARFDYVEKCIVCFHCLKHGENIQPDSFINIFTVLKATTFEKIIEKKFDELDLIVLHNVLINFYQQEMGVYTKGWDQLKDSIFCRIPLNEQNKYF